MHPRLGLVGLWLATASANTEKAIFVAPEPINIPSTHPNLDDLHVHTLTPSRWAVRTHVEAQFPSTATPAGKATWLVLDELTEGQRYEVRVCWAATQPTAFALNHYELPTVFETPELITELFDYSTARRPPDDGPGQAHAEAQGRPAAAERTASVLLLQILAAADYYTTNKTLMSDVPPVYVDIILDPYVFNLLPRSLLPTIGYVAVVAILSWFLAWRIAGWVRTVATEPDRSKKEQ